MMTARVITDAAGLAEIRTEWEDLLARTAGATPTQSPTWLGVWWDVFGPLDGRALRVVTVREGTRLVGLAPLLARRHTYALGIAFRRLELLGSGEDAADAVCSEYLGVLAERGLEEAVAATLAQALVARAAGEWDELVLPAMSGEGVLPALLADALRGYGVAARVEVTGVAPYVPLPASWDAYLAALPASRRYLVRRTVQDLEAWAGGALRLERANSRARLERGQRILAGLHAEQWSAEGPAGARGSPRFAAFHEAVMPALLEAGALDLWWLAVDAEPVVAAYCVVSRGRVYFHQSGRRLDLPKGIRAGIAVHAFAIREAISAGMREYDFLGGVASPQLDLALAARPLVRLRAARPSVLEAARRVSELALDQARAVRDGVRRWFRAAA